MRNPLLRKLQVFLLAFLICFQFAAQAHVAGHPSIHDTVVGILDRFAQTIPLEELNQLNAEKVLARLTPEERDTLAMEYLSFDVNVPVIVSILPYKGYPYDPFWLKDLDFQHTKLQAKVNGRDYKVWQKQFDAGRVGLGVNSLTGGGRHYYVVLRAADPGKKLEITHLYPGQYAVETIQPGEHPIAGEDELTAELPQELIGQTALIGQADRRYEAQLVNVLKATPYPSSDEADHVVLTWSEDPRTTQTIQWRTDTSVHRGYVLYQKKAAYASFRPRRPMRANATTTLMDTWDILNDPKCHRHTVVLRNLEPDTTYIYSIGKGERMEFTTAPDGIDPFSFIYMGDAQNGLERWGSLIQGAFRRRPDAAFYIMAGDLVNRGADRDDWDSYFENAEGVYDRRPIVPALGNHEYHRYDLTGRLLYEEMFTLPASSPLGEKTYSFHYSNALFVILDSNQDATEQTAWLEEQLAGSNATWKFVVYHHPAYSSSPRRDNPEIRQLWGNLFDQYHVDMALQGHDHAYLRTYPMKGGQRQESSKEGTIYVVSVSGTKMYDVGDFDYAEEAFANVSTYQVLDIQISGDRLVYRAYDMEGDLRDEFVIEK